jgi:hypothetical protein
MQVGACATSVPLIRDALQAVPTSTIETKISEWKMLSFTFPNVLWGTRIQSRNAILHQRRIEQSRGVFDFDEPGQSSVGFLDQVDLLDREPLVLILSPDV